MAGLALEVARGRGPVQPPCVLLSGGETTVTVRGSGRGGRNVEFLLALGVALGVALGERANVFALAADTDGVDGTEPIAGAIWRPDTLGRAAARGLDPHDFLARNDAHAFFESLGDSVVTGPTRTNVNDFRAVLVLPAGAGAAR
jgi:hydroxypyruvate reductase